MKPKKTHTKSKFIRMGCAAMCLFYLLGLFNGLVLETLHEVSHVLAPKTHHHNFASDHEAIDYSSLEAMVGHSHEALEALKDLLEASQTDEQESKDDFTLKLDKHFVKEIRIASEIKTLPIGNGNWVYQCMTSFWSQSVTTPPPQHS
ncbi:hypothetical protein PY092_12235 [Muricauda sp. 334s03]|uniref:Uncharacterized protein n=1 Tax=Flagellimonas yonaguniensis TaxID=3031325 RepID=A0ABT5Y1I2_9FLAO|nr:hypothetical protein [[Muricauda] yonaguniensis]MDF0716922.1 hypothetical protein [[Muricauda] yonaguniensis]